MVFHRILLHLPHKVEKRCEIQIFTVFAATLHSMLSDLCEFVTKLVVAGLLWSLAETRQSAHDKGHAELR